MVKQFAPSRTDADDVWVLLPKIAVHHGPAFDTGGPRVRGSAAGHAWS
jgi:aconitate decarboxylase